MSKHLFISVSNMTEREKTVVFVKNTQKKVENEQKDKNYLNMRVPGLGGRVNTYFLALKLFLL